MNNKLWQLFLKPSLKPKILKYSVAFNKNLSDELYDAVIINPLESNEPIKSLDFSLRQINGYLKEDGQLCVVFNNRYSYARLLGRKGFSYKTSFALNEIKSALRSADMGNFNIYALYPASEKIKIISKFEKDIFNGNVMNIKDLIKQRLLNNRLFRTFFPAFAVIATGNKYNFESLIDSLENKLGHGEIQRIILGNPDTVILEFKNAILRVPLGKFGIARCRLNKRVLRTIEKTIFKDFVPRFFKEDKFCGWDYYCEEKIKGFQINPPNKRNENLMRKAADFITSFHKETSKYISLDESHFKKLFSKNIKVLSRFLNEEYQKKLELIESKLKEQLIGKSFKSVWMHGDYKLENILFDDKTELLKGVIDWDLSRINGLPLLDLAYLLVYNASLLIRHDLSEVFKDKFLKKEFSSFESELINKYLSDLGIEYEFIDSLLIVFWLHHITQRYYSLLIGNSARRQEWLKDSVYSVIDEILNSIIMKK